VRVAIDERGKLAIVQDKSNDVCLKREGRRICGLLMCEEEEEDLSLSLSLSLSSYHHLHQIGLSFSLAPSLLLPTVQLIVETLYNSLPVCLGVLL